MERRRAHRLFIRWPVGGVARVRVGARRLAAGARTIPRVRTLSTSILLGRGLPVAGEVSCSASQASMALRSYVTPSMVKTGSVSSCFVRGQMSAAAIEAEGPRESAGEECAVGEVGEWTLSWSHFCRHASSAGSGASDMAAGKDSARAGLLWPVPSCPSAARKALFFSDALFFGAVLARLETNSKTIRNTRSQFPPATTGSQLPAEASCSAPSRTLRTSSPAASVGQKILSLSLSLQRSPV